MRKKLRMEEVVALWLKEKRNYIKTSTYAYYLFAAENYIILQLGKKSITQITEKEIQNAVLYWQNQGGKKRGPMQKSTVQNLVMIIKQILKFAVKEGYIEDCSLKIRFLPPSHGRKQKVFSKKEQADIIHAILSEPSYKSFGILLCLNSGLRIGELCALRWEDFDFSNGIIHITKTLQRIYEQNSIPKTKIIISSPKTFTSIREIPLSYKMLEILDKLGNRSNKGYVLTNTQNYMEPRAFRRFYMQFLEKHQIVPLNFHCLRHTFATRCIENGGDYKSVSEILGHTTINTTLNMYVHPEIEEKRKCVDLIQW